MAVWKKLGRWSVQWGGKTRVGAFVVCMCAKILLRFAEECVAFYFPILVFRSDVHGVSDFISRVIPVSWSKCINLSDD